MSAKRRARQAEAKPFREELIRIVGKCECCGCSPTERGGKSPQMARLSVHEIANGPNRQNALDASYAVLVACWDCNGGLLDRKGDCPESAQLAMLARSRPKDFSLASYLQLTSPNAPLRIEPYEVLEHMTERYLDKNEIAELMGVDRRSVQNWIENDEFPNAIDARTVGAARPLWRIPVSDYEAFAERRKVSRETS